ncbi:MAG: plastocyanin/azurin family copper-binding protein [Halolamina sp.]
MNRRRFLAAVGTGATLSAAGCLGAAGSESDDYDVGMTAVAYDPVEVTVAVGDTVRWKNTSSRAHTVSAYEDRIPEAATYFASGGYDSEAGAREAWTNDLGGALTSGDTYERTFEVAGSYEYFCVPHEQGGMVGTIVVEE